MKAQTRGAPRRETEKVDAEGMEHHVSEETLQVFERFIIGR